jgi:hypothetical protein
MKCCLAPATDLSFLLQLLLELNSSLLRRRLHFGDQCFNTGCCFFG